LIIHFKILFLTIYFSYLPEEQYLHFVYLALIQKLAVLGFRGCTHPSQRLTHTHANDHQLANIRKHTDTGNLFCLPRNLKRPWTAFDSCFRCLFWHCPRPACHLWERNLHYVHIICDNYTAVDKLKIRCGFYASQSWNKGYFVLGEKNATSRGMCFTSELIIDLKNIYGLMI